MRFDAANIAWIPALIVLGLAGCLSPEEPGDARTWDGAFAVTDTLTLLDVTPPSDSVGGLLKIRKLYQTCEGSTVKTDSFEFTQRYALADGALYLWYGGSCRGEKFAGTSSSLVGTWTRSGYVPMDSIPARYTAGCMGSSLIIGVTFEDYRESYEISETGMTVKTSGRICLADQAARDGYRAGYEVLEQGCGTAKLRNRDTGRTLQVTSSYANEGVTLRFSSAGKTCSRAIAVDLSQKGPKCPEPEASQDFQDCMDGLAFD